MHVTGQALFLNELVFDIVVPAKMFKYGIFLLELFLHRDYEKPSFLFGNLYVDQSQALFLIAYFF